MTPLHPLKEGSTLPADKLFGPDLHAYLEEQVRLRNLDPEYRFEPPKTDTAPHVDVGHGVIRNGKPRQYI